MSYSTLSELPPPPSDKTGWPWTEGNQVLTDHMPNGNHWPLVSIVTPSYNQGQFIEETIRSVLLQGYPNLEYIIIDGGSTDNSVEIIRKYEPWIAYWVSEPDNGQSEAINKGWSISQGDILAWLNSDDTYTPNAFSVVSMIFAKNPNAGMVYGDGNFIDEGSQYTSSIISEQLNLADILTTGKGIPQPTCFFPRHTIKKIGLLNQELQYTLDFDYLLRIAEYFELFYVNQKLANIRIWDETKMVMHSEKWLSEEIKILDHIFSNHDFGHKTKDIESSAYGKLYWNRGVSYYAHGQKIQGCKYCNLALQYSDWLDKNIHRIINSLVYRERSIKVEQREEFIIRVLNDLPSEIKKIYNLDKKIWREYYSMKYYLAHLSGDRKEAINSFGKLIYRFPLSIKDKGLLSMIITDITGQKI